MSEGQNDYRIMPIREKGKATYILFDKNLKPADILSYLEKKHGLNIQMWRFICGALVLVGELFRFEDTLPFPVGDLVWIECSTSLIGCAL